MDLTWVNDFDGLSPITGVRVVAIILPEGITVSFMDIPGNASLQFATVPNLLPFTEYEFRLSIRNDIGLSPFVFKRARTRSLSKQSS